MKSATRGLRYFSRLTVIIIIAVLGFSLPGYSASYSLLSDQPLDAPLSAQGAGLPAGFPSAWRSREVALNPVIASSDALVPGDVITLNLFADTVLTVQVDRLSENVNGTVTVRGRIEDYPLGYLIISTTNNNSLASIRIPETGEHYRIQMDTLTGIHYLFEENTDQLNELEDGPSPIPPPATKQEAEEARILSDIIVAGPLNPVNLDVMIVYTPAAMSWAGGVVGINNVIAQAVAKSQLVLDNSNTVLTITLVYSGEVTYTESGDSYTDLGRLTNTSDGYMDDVHTRRNQYGADVVGLFTKVEDTGGLAWLLNTTSGSPAYAFSITRVQQASWTYTYIHEMGHNMGCHHHKQQNVQPGPGLFSYSAGWRWVGNDSGKYCSVMTYQNGSYFSDGQTHTRVAYFSNPSIDYQGVPTGHATEGDNARTLREIKDVIAAYRQQTDTTAPTPNPMTWETYPDETSTSSMSMVATSASDASTPIYYQFDYYDSPTGGSGGTDSGWQTSRTYTDSGLGTNHQYGYRVWARDSAPAQNTTAYSSPVSYDYTDIETPSGITFGTITTTSIQAQSSNTPSGLTRGGSGLIIYNVTSDTDSGWKQNNDLWTNGSLSVNTQYGFKAQARNGDGNPTGLSPDGYCYTLAHTPGADSFSNVTDSSIQANWNANGNPIGTEYYCENITKGTNSDWTTETYWNESGLNYATEYCYQVRARNGDSVETTSLDLGCQQTVSLPMICDNVIITMNDFAILASYWLDSSCSPGDQWCRGADFNQLDGVNDDDLMTLARIWLNPCQDFTAVDCYAADPNDLSTPLDIVCEEDNVHICFKFDYSGPGAAATTHFQLDNDPSAEVTEFYTEGTHIYSCPWRATLGSHRLQAWCDFNDDVTETNEANNYLDENPSFTVVQYNPPGMCFENVNSWSAYDPGANGVGTDPDGFTGSVFDGRYVYFVPNYNGTERHGEVLRYDTTLAFTSPAAWSAYDAGANGVGTDPDGFTGSVFDGRYVYFAPNHNGTERHGEVLRYDTNGDFENVSSWDAYDPGENGVGTDPDGYAGGVVYDDNRYVYFVPNHNGTELHGEVLRYDTTLAFTSPTAWSAYDAGANGIGADPNGFYGGVFDGRYVYFVPEYNGTDFHGEVLRYDTTQDFTVSASWSTYDPGSNGVGIDPDGYRGAAFDGRYIYLAPDYNGTAFHGEVLRYDTSADFFTVASWSTFDPGINGVGANAIGFRGAIFDGRFVYFVPEHDNAGDVHGEVLRFDTTNDFATASSWAAFEPGANGVGTAPYGYAGGVFDGTHIYFAPMDNKSPGYHGEVLRYDTTAACP